VKSKKSKRVLRGRSAGIMIEDYDSKLDLVVEKITSLDEKVDRLDERVDHLDQKVTEGFDRFDKRFDRVELRLDRIESEIVGIRILLGEHDAAIKRHDQDILLLKQASSH
jgi:predicted nuclease with TOPRIM domain